MDENIKEQALAFHEFPSPGKIHVEPSKPLATQLDLSLAYSPGVAAPCMEIYENPAAANRYTSKGNLVAVVTNGTAVLGLGNIGPLAGKPVMEGKGTLFKKFAGIDVFDIEVNETDPDKLVDIISSLEPTFGGINLEDIKAPECFYVEKKLRERMSIPVFHDDQHGTAIITTAAVINALKVGGKNIGEVKLVCSGAGAAAIACLDLLVASGLKKENISVFDSKGLVAQNRDSIDDSKRRYASPLDASTTMAQVIAGADVFLGLSKPNVLSVEMLKTMGPHPLILALANPTPEIWPPEAKKARPDCIIGTGRSDFPNQVNNVLCFPFIFRGALDVQATTINKEMQLAAVKAIADLALAEQSDQVAQAYGSNEAGEHGFGPDYIIPKPFDPRLITKIAPAVAKAAMESGVARKKIDDLQAYEESLVQFVYRTSLFMNPIFRRAKKNPKRVVLCEGEDRRVLYVAQQLANTRAAKPILIGRRSVIESRIRQLGLTVRPGVDFELVDNENDPRFRDYWQDYYNCSKRKGVDQNFAKRRMIGNTTLIGATMIKRGDADALICGTYGTYKYHFNTIRDVLGYKKGRNVACAMNAIILNNRNLFIADTYVNDNPDALTLADITEMCADEIARLGIKPKIALISNSNFGSYQTEEAMKMAEAARIVSERRPDLEIDGEMQADVALNPEMRGSIMPDSTLTGSANLLVMPNVMAANISYNLLRSAAKGVTVGPILMGIDGPCHVVTPISSVRRLLNMVAVASVDADRIAAGGAEAGN